MNFCRRCKKCGKMYLMSLFDRGLCADCEKAEQEPCDDVVSRQAVLKTLDDMDNVLDEDRTVENYKELLKECYEVLPSVRPQEQTGHWTKDKEPWGGSQGWKCDKCNHIYDINVVYSKMPYNFCPNCGAKMVEPQERSDKEC